ncbi:hypothetical protein JR316_0013133 [Psilocybe cubensis]|uniref:Uncharacterized protein n=2 Tax=Psilocybe cubensis TaxID=181762 RepID=A0ACB8GGC7_PSICU|nr:hypothetical protein JR316_0013133 [Psilocybe cubensis]KAH9474669.1 hypothetical protein JR316_0013133 [Psilocybe cubensis]
MNSPASEQHLTVISVQNMDSPASEQYDDAVSHEQHLTLYSEEQIGAYNLVSNAALRMISIIEIALPSTMTLCQDLGAALSSSAVTELNIHGELCPAAVSWLLDEKWRIVLGQLTVLRYKLDLTTAEDEFEEQVNCPWDSPLWPKMLSRCTSLVLFLVKTPVLIQFDHGLSPDFTISKAVEKWNLESIKTLRRFYLFHAYKSTRVTDLYGCHNLLWRTSENDQWHQTIIRPPKKIMSLHRRLLRYSADRIEDSDIDVFDSDDSDDTDDTDDADEYDD